ncbi:MarC family protein [Alphaproteobacteria bacterium]|jgi:multiple antibiotic resistance protein|nr:MarC family protein [Alphaproteobacteria bacterium]
MLELFIQSFVIYFVVVDPLGNGPIFLSLTQSQNTKEKIQTSIEAVSIATIILISFSVIGKFILSYLSISLASFRIAGGLILFIIALEMLFNKRQERKEQIANEVKDKVSIFPLAIPILSGPAAITSIIVIMSDIGDNIVYQLVSIASLVSVMLITLVLFMIISKSGDFINKKIINVFSRVIAIILAALSVQYIIDGLLEIF